MSYKVIIKDLVNKDPESEISFVFNNSLEAVLELCKIILQSNKFSVQIMKISNSMQRKRTRIFYE